MINFYYVKKANIKKHNPNWTQIPNHPYSILIIEDFGSEKTIALLNLISHQQDKVTGLFTRGTKMNIYVVSITQTYFTVPKNIRLISTHYSIILL